MRTVPRTVSRQTRTLRTMVTKDERWTPATNRAGQGLIDNKQALELNKVVPNIESMWTKMSKEEQYSVYKQLEQLQRKDWHELSLGEKKAGAYLALTLRSAKTDSLAAYFVSYGPHGPRKPAVPPGQNAKVLIGTTVAVSIALALFFGVRSMTPPAPKTMTPEYQQKATERAQEHRLNPITGVSSEGYKGKGLVQ